jgi:hypothetical protein
MPFRASRRSERSRRGPAPGGATGFLSGAVARSELAFGQEVDARLLQDLAQGLPVEAQGSPVAARDDPHVQLRGDAGDVRVGRGHDGRPVTGVLQELLVAGAEGRGAAHGGVGIDGGDRKALELGVSPAYPDLVIDQGVALASRLRLVDLTSSFARK